MSDSTTTPAGLATPLDLGGLMLPNRIVMAPLTRNRAGQGNVPTAMNALYYTQRASAGLLITEASQISPQGVGYPSTPGIHDDAQVAGWRKVTEAVHAAGGRIFIQLWHVGRISHPSLQPGGELPVAPSAICPDRRGGDLRRHAALRHPARARPRRDPGYRGRLCRAAERAREAGFDGVEIHAANGYLLDQFLRDGTNHRGDRYGGSLDNRLRLLDEVVTAVKAVWPAARIGVRLSPENSFNDISDSDPQQTFNAVAERLRDQQIGYLHVLEGDMLSGEQALDYAQIRARFAGLYMANNGYTQARAEQALQQGDVDLVAFGRPFIANPDLPERFARGAALNEPDADTFYGGDERGYTDYPAL